MHTSYTHARTHTHIVAPGSSMNRSNRIAPEEARPSEEAEAAAATEDNITEEELYREAVKERHDRAP